MHGLLFDLSESHAMHKKSRSDWIIGCDWSVQWIPKDRYNHANANAMDNGPTLEMGSFLTSLKTQ